MNDQPTPRPTHHVHRGPDSLPCYCAATSDHPIGQEVNTQPEHQAPDPIDSLLETLQPAKGTTPPPPTPGGSETPENSSPSWSELSLMLKTQRQINEDLLSRLRTAEAEKDETLTRFTRVMDERDQLRAEVERLTRERDIIIAEFDSVGVAIGPITLEADSLVMTPGQRMVAAIASLRSQLATALADRDAWREKAQAGEVEVERLMGERDKITWWKKRFGERLQKNGKIIVEQFRQLDTLRTEHEATLRELAEVRKTMRSVDDYLRRIEDTRFGWDGDCGVIGLANGARDLIDAARSPEPREPSAGTTEGGEG